MSGLLPALLLFTAVTGMWQAERRGDELQIRLLEDGEHRPVQELRVPIASLTGIASRRIDSARPAPVSFQLKCGAGTFAFEGSFTNARGFGLFIFSNGRGHLSADRCPPDAARTR
jgi:hypothetical protein